MKDYKDLVRLAEYFGFLVTSTTGGRHNRHSKHALGLAIDVRTRNRGDAEIRRFIRQCAAIGVRVRDERTRPNNQKVWSGAHLHLEIDARTIEKVLQFQRRNALEADGIVGTRTLAALDSLA